MPKPCWRTLAVPFGCIRAPRVPATMAKAPADQRPLQWGPVLALRRESMAVRKAVQQSLSAESDLIVARDVTQRKLSQMYGFRFRKPTQTSLLSNGASCVCVDIGLRLTRLHKIHRSDGAKFGCSPPVRIGEAMLPTSSRSARLSTPSKHQRTRESAAFEKRRPSVTTMETARKRSDAYQSRQSQR